MSGEEDLLFVARHGEGEVVAAWVVELVPLLVSVFDGVPYPLWPALGDLAVESRATEPSG